MDRNVQEKQAKHDMTYFLTREAAASAGGQERERKRKERRDTGKGEREREKSDHRKQSAAQSTSQLGPAAAKAAPVANGGTTRRVWVPSQEPVVCHRAPSEARVCWVSQPGKFW